MRIHIWTGKLEKLRQFYREAEYDEWQEIGESGIYAVAEFNEKIIGATGLLDENGHLILKAVLVLAKFRRRRIGTLIVARLVGIADRNCYCICPPHLESFYATSGFVRVNEEDKNMPAFLQARLEKRKRAGASPMLVLCRHH